jgi:hypothetical protein
VCASRWVSLAGESVHELLTVLTTASDEVWSIARKILTPEQEVRLARMIASWQEENPDQHRVEGIRFVEFSAMARDAHRIGEASGLLSPVKAVTARADQALLLGERAMFLAPRIPFLIRLHTRVGALEVLDDVTSKLAHVEGLLRKVTELEPMLHHTNELLRRAGDLTVQAGTTIGAARELSDTALPLLQGAERLLAGGPEHTAMPNRVELLMRASDGLLARVHELLGRVTALVGDDPAQALAAVEGSVTRSAEQLLWKAGAVGAALIALFWAGYFLAVR